MSSPVPSLQNRWQLVRGCSLPSRLRHVLVVLMLYQGENKAVWCKRSTLADEIGVAEGTLSNLMAELEARKIVKRVWTSRNGRPWREHEICFDELSKCQRPLSQIHETAPSQIRDTAPSRNNDTGGSTLTNSGRSPSQIHEGHSHESVRHEVSNRTSNRNTRPKFEPSDMETAEFIRDLIHEMQPSRKQPDLAKWANTVRLMRERDKRTDRQIRDLFLLAHRDAFWRMNILSPDKLRQRWDDLQLKLSGPNTTDGGGDFAKVCQVVRRVYSPDVRNHQAVAAELTPEQFRAARAVGLDRLSSGGSESRSLAAEFATALEAPA